MTLVTFMTDRKFSSIHEIMSSRTKLQFATKFATTLAIRFATKVVTKLITITMITNNAKCLIVDIQDINMW